MNLLSLLLALLTCTTGTGDSPKAPSPESLGEGRYRIGKIGIDARRAEVAFPARVNLRDVPMEYAIVGAAGKLHESVLRTDADPFHIHLAMLLLGIHPPGKVFPSGQPIDVLLSWEEEGARRRGRMEDWIAVGDAQLRMSPGPWIYNGSRMAEGAFAASRGHSILSLILDRDALANNPRDGNANDDIWLPRTDAIPPIDTPVRVVFRRVGPPPSKPSSDLTTRPRTGEQGPER